MSFWIASSRLLTVDNTLIIQNMPMVTPKRERKVLSLLERNSSKAILKLLSIMEKNFMWQIYNESPLAGYIKV